MGRFTEGSVLVAILILTTLSLVQAAIPTDASVFECQNRDVALGTNVTCYFLADEDGGTETTFRASYEPTSTLNPLPAPPSTVVQVGTSRRYILWFQPLSSGTLVVVGRINGQPSKFGEQVITVQDYPAPTISNYSPAQAPRCEREYVTIRGSNFGVAPEVLKSVSVRGRACETYSWVSSSEVTCTALGADYPGPVVVETIVGVGTSSRNMTVGGANTRPVVDTVSPAATEAQVSKEIFIGGRMFGQNATYLKEIRLAGRKCDKISWQSSNVVYCISPKVDGQVTGPVEVITTSVCAPVEGEKKFTFQGPRILTVTPDLGPLEGGTEVVVVGSNLGTNASEILRFEVAGVSCLKSLRVVSPAEIRCKTAAVPGETKGTVLVQTALGGSGQGGSFRYVNFNSTGDSSLDIFSVVERVRPTEGDTEGGEQVTIFGRNFGSSAGELQSVMVGDKPANDVLWLNNQNILFRAPRNKPGVYPVTIRVASSRGRDSSQASYTYKYTGPLILTIEKGTARESDTEDLGLVRAQLATPPLLDVLVSFESLHPEVCQPVPPTLTFSSENFGEELFLNITAVQDNRRDGNRTCAVSVNVVSSDKDLDDLLLPNMNFISLDARPRVTSMNPPSLTREGGNTTFFGTDFDSFGVKLSVGVQNCTHLQYLTARDLQAEAEAASRPPAIPTPAPAPTPIAPGTPSSPGTNSTASASATPSADATPTTSTGTNTSLRALSSRYQQAAMPRPPPPPTRLSSVTLGTQPRFQVAQSNQTTAAPPVNGDAIVAIRATIPRGLKEGYHEVRITNPDRTSSVIGDIYYTSDLCPQVNTYFTGEECEVCPPGGICRGGGAIWPKAGNWNPQEDIGKVAECNPPERCLGCDDFDTRTQCYPDPEKGSPCAEGYFGDMCAACAEGRYSTTGICLLCPVGDPNTTLAIVTISLWLIFGIVCLFVEKDKNLYIGASFIIIVQSMATMRQLFNTRVPEWTRDVFGYLYVTAGDASTFRLACAGYESYHFRFAIRVIMMLMIGAPMHMGNNLAYAASEWFHSEEPKEVLDERRSHYAHRKMRNLFVHVHIIYYVLTQVCTSVLGCRQLFGVLRLVSDNSVLCFKGLHYLVFIAAFPLLILITIGYPLLNWWLLKRPLFHEDSPEGEAFRHKYGFALEAFRPGAERLILLECFVRACNAIASGSLEAHPIAQLLCVAPINLIWGVLCVVIRGYRATMLNWLTLLASLVNVLAAVLSFTAAKNGSTSTIDLLSMIVVGGAGIVACIALYHSLHYLLFVWIPREEVEYDTAFDKGFDEIFKLLTVKEGGEGGDDAGNEGWGVDNFVGDISTGIGSLTSVLGQSGGSNAQLPPLAGGAKGAKGDKGGNKRRPAKDALSEDEIEQEIEISISESSDDSGTMDTAMSLNTNE